MKVESLSTAQVTQLHDFIDEYLTIGRSVNPSDRATTERIITSFYRRIGEESPYFWWCDGPAVGSLVRMLIRANLHANLRDNLYANLHDNLHANLGDNLGANLRDNLGANLGANLHDNLHANLGANLRANLHANLRASLYANLHANLHANLRDNLGANLRDNLGDNLRANLGANLHANLDASLYANLGDNLGANLHANLHANLDDNLRDNLGDNLRDNLRWGFWGAHEVYWIAFYLFPHKYIRPMHTYEQMSDLAEWEVLSRSTGWWHPFRGVVFLCERPCSQLVDSAGRLHSATGPALQCRDGWEVWAWKNVRVSEQIVMRPETITAEQIAKETNAQVRQVMVERIGIERVCQMFKAVSIDRKIVRLREGEWKGANRGATGGSELPYELLMLDIGDGRKRPYLKMLNPSIGVWHVEGVHPDCKTVQQAINWRAGNVKEDWKPEVLT